VTMAATAIKLETESESQGKAGNCLVGGTYTSVQVACVEMALRAMLRPKNPDPATQVMTRMLEISNSPRLDRARDLQSRYAAPTTSRPTVPPRM
jgi:hypothetical protein